METKFRPIAMRCTKEQFDKIKSKLEGIKGIEIISIRDFTDAPYLVNNFCGCKGEVANNNNHNKDRYSREVFEEWNEETFLQYCGIFVLPEKWCVKPKNLNEAQELGKYFDKTLPCGSGRNWYTNKASECIDEYWGYSFRKGDVLYNSPSAGYTEITFNQFLKYVLKQENMACALYSFMDDSQEESKSRFPFALKSTDAQRIIDIACPTWKPRLAEKWGYSIVIGIDNLIDEVEYKAMRKACTKEQNKLFDEIFGKDDAIDFSILNDKDVFYLKTKSGNPFVFKGDPFKVNSYTGYDVNLSTKLTAYVGICGRNQVVELRKANEDEIELYNRHYPNYKKGDWITVVEVACGKNGTKGHSYLITESGERFLSFDSRYALNNESGVIDIDYVIVRLATQEEINKTKFPFKKGEYIVVSVGRDVWFIERFVKISNNEIIAKDSENNESYWKYAMSLKEFNKKYNK